MIEYAELLKSAAGQIDELSERISNLCSAERRRLGYEDLQPRNLIPFRAAHSLGTVFPSTRRIKGVAIDAAEANFRIVSPMINVVLEIGWEDNSENRALTLACRLLGLPWLYVRKALADARIYDAKSAAEVWAPQMKETDARCVGKIYVAKADDHPTIIKIGFSTQVPIRVRQLSKQVGSNVRLLNSFPATQIHEYALHQCLGRRRIASEWYPHDVVPSWLAGGEA